MTQQIERLARARLALEGLSVGDAFGEQFFTVPAGGLRGGEIPPPPWKHTDDTAMASALYQVLQTHGEVQQDALAKEFARRHALEPDRGYGKGTRRLLAQVSAGGDWRTLASEVFDGGSFGNGAAMRVAPLGAFFADDFDRVVDEAACQAEITHAHPEGIAGAIAAAVATAWAYRWQVEGKRKPAEELIKTVMEQTPAGGVRDRLQQAMSIPLDELPHTAAAVLGNGEQVSAVDTVPFCVWCAAAHLDDYCEALWAAVRVRGDVDTTCAIIGGIVVMAAPKVGIPREWLYAREALWIEAD